MIDVKDLVENPDKYRASQRARGEDAALVERVISADASRRSAITGYENLRAEQNAFSKKVARAQGGEKQDLVAQAKGLAGQVKQASVDADTAEEHLRELLRVFPNLVIEAVPAGGEEDFTVLKTVGTPRNFDFPVRDHLDLGEGMDGIDMQRGAKVSGARFTFLKGQIARLEVALVNMAMDQGVRYGFVPMITPTLVRPEIMAGTGFDVEHDEEIYHLDRDDLYLVGTSEVALAGYHANEIIDLSTGPERYLGVSSCYRREAGSAGKDTRGIVRVHQFNKAEMFSYVDPADAADEHARMLAWEEEMLAKLNVPYRVIDTAAGDLGSSAARKFDCEAWIPSQGKFRELTSTSNCTTYQTRRLNTRARGPEGKGTVPVATLNGTLATDRWIVAILENHQNVDGSVTVPERIRPYLGLDTLQPVH